ncbi:MAG: Omp28-related outer membrane protein [Flavobacteriales bacterium]|nr:Omp28-related outer membrane protein [Flavobacteriales bacterium]
MRKILLTGVGIILCTSLISQNFNPALGKVVLGEEQTGTWCGNCPRGTVYMDYMSNTYPDHWIAVAIHSSDPMENVIYKDGLNDLIGGMYPLMTVNRSGYWGIDPTDVEADFLDEVENPPVAFLTNGALYNVSSRQLEVSVTVDFQMATSGNWKLGVILTEDGVTGTTSGYDQSNYYSGGGQGVMGGFELLSDPVPASEMVYNHVARMISPSFEGADNLFPTTLNIGESFNVCFSFSLPIEWDENNIHIISFLADPSGDVDNAAQESIATAVANGFTSCSVGVEEKLTKKLNFSLFPNPTNGVTYIEIINNEHKDVNVSIIDMTGKLVANREYDITGTVQLPINISSLDKGIYFVTLRVGGSVKQQKLIVQ